MLDYPQSLLFAENSNGCGVLIIRPGSELKEVYTYQSMKISVKEFYLLLISDPTRKILEGSNVCPSLITYATYPLKKL